MLGVADTSEGALRRAGWTESTGGEMVGILVRGTLELFKIGLPSELMRGLDESLTLAEMSLSGGTGGISLLRRSRFPVKSPLILSSI